MDRNHNILVISILSFFMHGCISCEQKEYLGDLSQTKVEFKDVVGKYIHVPIVVENENINDYKTFGLEKGDTLKLEIKPDSTFIFNYFYYDNLKRIDNYQGKLKKEYGFYTFSIPFPNDNKHSTQGYVRSKDGLYFYIRLKMKGFENYEYQLFYKKIKQ